MNESKEEPEKHKPDIKTLDASKGGTVAVGDGARATKVGEGGVYVEKQINIAIGDLISPRHRWVLGVVLAGIAATTVYAVIHWPVPPAPAVPTQPATFVPIGSATPVAPPPVSPGTPAPVSITSAPSFSPKSGASPSSFADLMAMIYVPEGAFLMGTDSHDAMTECLKFFTDCQRGWFLSEEPPHNVNLSAFWIDRTEITNAMYAQCVRARGCQQPNGTNSNTRDGYIDDSRYGDYPVIYVTWLDAQAYCRWAGRRLPTEAEWEKAARGSNGSMYPWGNDAPNSNLLNYDAVIGDTTEVGSYQNGASVYGALDMAGNVWEWVADWYGENYYASSPAAVPTGPSSGTQRVNRGGSWAGDAGDVRSAHRNKDGPTWSSYELGFRCATSTQ